MEIYSAELVFTLVLVLWPVGNEDLYNLVLNGGVGGVSSSIYHEVQHIIIV